MTVGGKALVSWFNCKDTAHSNRVKSDDFLGKALSKLINLGILSEAHFGDEEQVCKTLRAHPIKSFEQSRAGWGRLNETKPVSRAACTLTAGSP